MCLVDWLVVWFAFVCLLVYLFVCPSVFCSFVRFLFNYQYTVHKH